MISRNHADFEGEDGKEDTKKRYFNQIKEPRGFCAGPLVRSSGDGGVNWSGILKVLPSLVYVTHRDVEPACVRFPASVFKLTFETSGSGRFTGQRLTDSPIRHGNS